MGTVLGSSVNQPAWVPGAEEPVFAEPWEARAFAMVVSLHERGLYTWAEWADALPTRIGADATGDPDLGDSYYHHWLGALEDVLARNGIGPAETARRRRPRQRAANPTPRAEPVELQADAF